VSKTILNELGIIFKQLKFLNFMSFGNVSTQINLDGSGTTLLVGENLDNGGSSGAGKSTLINAISFALYDKIPSGVSKDKLINRTNEKKNTLMEVELLFTKGTNEYSVKRWRGTSTGVKLTLNGADVTPASVNRGEDSFNAKVEEILGFSYNLFSQIILFNGNSRPFLDLSVGAQRELIEELFRITILTRKANALKTLSSETEKSIGLQRVLIQQQLKQSETYQRHLTEAQERINKWDLARAAELEKIQAALDAAAKVDFEGEEAVHGELVDLRSAVSELKSTVQTLSSQRSMKEREKSPKTSTLVITENDLSKKKSDLEKVSKELTHLRDAKCPYCLQKFEDAQAKITEMESKELSLRVEIDQLTEKVGELNSEVDTFNVELTKSVAELTQNISEAQGALIEVQEQLNAAIGGLQYSDLNLLLRAKVEVTNLHSRLEVMLNETNPHVEAHAALLAEGAVQVNDAELNALEKLQTHQKFLLKLLTDKNSFIRKNIISKTIPFLNKRIAYYTEKLNLPHIVLFQPDMSCEITQIGRDLDHGNLSNGEKKKLNLSLCLAFRDVLTYLHSKVNVLFTDEVDGGSISGPDVDSLISMLKSKAWDDDISIFIISHRPEFDGRTDHNLVIRKESGFSTLIDQPDS